MIILIGFVILFAGLIIGMPVVYAFGATALVMVLGLGYDMSFIMTTAYFRVSSFALLCIPLFVLAGGVIEKGRMGGYLADFINKLMGRARFSLGYVSCIASGLFGALTGSAAATQACIGSVMTPRLKEAGYPDGYIGALFANASVLGLLIPPSTLMIVVAWSTGLSVLTCFMSTLIPGIILMLLFCVDTYFMLRKNPNIKAQPRHANAADWAKDFGRTTKKAFPVLLMPIIILGGIYGGFMTPTESAAIGGFYAVLAAMFIYRSLKLKELKQTLIDAGTTAGVILMSIFMVGVISKVLTYAGLPDLISKTILGISDNKYVVLLVINLILVVMGMMMDDTSAVLIAMPMFLPLAEGIGIDPYHFAAIVGVNMGMAAVTPPAAPSLYSSCRVCNTKIKDMLLPDVQMILFAWIPTLILTTIFPELSLAIPRMLGLIG